MLATPLWVNGLIVRGKRMQPLSVLYSVQKIFFINNYLKLLVFAYKCYSLTLLDMHTLSLP